MLAMLVAYDADGHVVATLDYLVARDAEGKVRGVHDFGELESRGGALTSLWQVSHAVGSGTWPEWLGPRATEFDVELEPGWSRSSLERPPFRIRALVHRESGHRRERAELDERISEARRRTPEGEPVDLRAIVGGPTAPIVLDERGRSGVDAPDHEAEDAPDGRGGSGGAGRP